MYLCICLLFSWKKTYGTQILLLSQVLILKYYSVRLYFNAIFVIFMEKVANKTFSLVNVFFFIIYGPDLNTAINNRQV